MKRARWSTIKRNDTHVPKVSVGKPVYNGDATLERPWIQFQGRRLPTLNRSSRTTLPPMLRKQFAANTWTDARVRYYRNSENVGASENYNAVFTSARGAYFKWASSNDICDRTLLAKCINALDHAPHVVLCYAQTRLLRDHLETAADYLDDLELLDPKPSVRFELSHLMM